MKGNTIFHHNDNYLLSMEFLSLNDLVLYLMLIHNSSH